MCLHTYIHINNMNRGISGKINSIRETLDNPVFLYSVTLLSTYLVPDIHAK